MVGAWPLTRERLDAFVQKALREGKRRSSWLEPDERYERLVQEYAWSLHGEMEPFVRRLAPIGEQIALAQTMLKLTCPGVPDIYQGDELESLNLVDPDNRRPVDWAASRRALADPPPKLRLIRDVLAAGVEGEYEPFDAGPGVCAFVRGSRHLVAVPVRPGAWVMAPPRWPDLFGGWLFERG